MVWDLRPVAMGGDDVRQHRRLLAAGWTAVLLLAIFAAVAGVAAYVAKQQQRKAEQAAVSERGARLNEEAARKDVSFINKLPKGAYGALVIAPLARAAFEPDTIVIYGNPAQVMRAIQAWVYQAGKRIQANFGGKVECAEYLMAPFKEGVPKVVVPGMGDRIFSLTQDDEMIFSLPAKGLSVFMEGLRDAGNKVGAQYPVPFFLNFEPQFPKAFLAIGKEVGLF